MSGVTMRTRDDGTVDLVVEGLKRSDAIAMADRILAMATPTRRALPAETATASRKERKKATPVECPICHEQVMPQGLVSHQRRHERLGERAA